MSSLQSMPLSGFTANDVPPSPFLEPLPIHPIPALKSPPGLNPFPLDSSFLHCKNAKWVANDFVVTRFPDAGSTMEMKVNLFGFVRETPDSVLQ